MKAALGRLAAFAGVTLFALSRLIPFQARTLRGVPGVLPKLIVTAASPWLGLWATAVAALGLVLKRPAAVAGALAAALTSLGYVVRVAGARARMEVFFGDDWEAKIAPERKARFLRSRAGWRLPTVAEPRFEQDAVYHTYPDGTRLRCDIWQPLAEVVPTGVALIYLHGSAWHYSDKDFLTRTLFRHLASQGHVIMDVAYRLCPDTDLGGMLSDAKHAVAFLKANAARYGVDPDRIVLSGASAGGHLALLAAYAPNHPRLTPRDLLDVDLKPRAVISMYGPTDLRPLYRYGRRIALDAPPLEWGRPYMVTPERISKVAERLKYRASDAAVKAATTSMPQIFANLLGGSPDEVPDMYELASPVSHIAPDAPLTLLFQGAADALVPAEIAREFYHTATARGVAVDYVEYEDTEHAFDLAMPDRGPATRSMIYDIERFLALVAVEPVPETARPARPAAVPEREAELAEV
jgi:acetyl esterase/lipase